MLINGNLDLEQIETKKGKNAQVFQLNCANVYYIFGDCLTCHRFIHAEIIEIDI